MEEITSTLLESLRVIEPAENLEQSLAKILRSRAEEKLRKMQSLVNYFQLRFGMTAEEFYQGRIRDKQHTWEDEDTYFDWIAFQQEAEEIGTEIKKLEGVLAHAER
jgi:hypothetical protein